MKSLYRVIDTGDETPPDPRRATDLDCSEGGGEEVLWQYLIAEINLLYDVISRVHITPKSVASVTHLTVLLVVFLIRDFR